MSSKWIFYGLYAGLTMILISIITNLLMPISLENYSTAEALGYLSILIGFLFVFFGLRAIRRKLGGEMKFSTALQYGLGISLIAAVMFAVYTALVLRVLYPDFADVAAEYYTQQINTSALTEAEKTEEIAQMQAMMANSDNFWFQSLVMFVTVLAVGLLVSLVSAFLVTRSGPKPGMA